jgi:hypothetical protein
MNNNVIFAIDPGSIKTGWAVLELPERLIEAGLLLPDKRAAGAEFRIDSICISLWELLDKHRPATILLEWPSGHVGRKRHHGGGAGLSIYGAACGSLWRECVAWRRSLPPEERIEVIIRLILESEWTRGIPKQDRAAVVAATFPEYRPEDDTGMDISDALGLAVWYSRRQMLKLMEAL